MIVLLETRNEEKSKSEQDFEYQNIGKNKLFYGEHNTLKSLYNLKLCFL